MKKVNLFFQSELSGISFEIFSITSFVIACTILEVDTGYLYKVKDKFPKDKMMIMIHAVALETLIADSQLLEILHYPVACNILMKHKPI